MPQTLNNIELKVKYIVYKLMYVLLALPVMGAGGGLLASCADSLDLSSSEGGASLGTGELVQFAAGTTVNSVATRADGEGENTSNTGSGSGSGESGSSSSEESSTSTNGSYTVTPGKTYYMPNAYRFVCRMYYKASTSSDKYDVSGNTDVTAWLKVKGDVGNSLYWRNSFADLGTDESLFDTYGNDKEAKMFYWQNRKEHAFLAWTNLNEARTIGYDPTPNSGTLKFQPEDIIYEKHTGQKEDQWIDNGYEVRLKNGNTVIFENWAALRTYMETGNNYQNVASTYNHPEFNDEYYYAYGWSCKYRVQKDATYETTDDNHRKYGWYEYQMFYDKLKYEGDTNDANFEIRKNEKNIPAYLYNKATNKYLAEIEIKYFKTNDSGGNPSSTETVTITDEHKTADGTAVDETNITDGTLIKAPKLLCGVGKTNLEAPSYYYINEDGTPVMETVPNPDYTDETTTPGVSPTITQRKPYNYYFETGDKEVTVTVGGVTYTCIQRMVIVAKCTFVYNLTDEYGNVKYDETKPRYTFYYKILQQKKNAEVVNSLPANVYDLTRREGMTSIADQPDIAQALTIQAPLGATQSANRVNLYFKHQFSLVQVNVKSSADLSVVINKNHIKKVELLGVTEKGYVFTELDEDGHVEPANYESVDVSKYSDEHLKQNQYGTSFNMFDMATGKDVDGNPIPSDDKTTADAGYALGYIKSFNALTFGQLQAIRITWNEAEDGSGISHESTYHVADETLKNLQSGHKYIWNIELRRGTLAIVRTEIVDWIVPQTKADPNSPYADLEYGTDGTINN